MSFRFLHRPLLGTPALVRSFGTKKPMDLFKEGVEHLNRAQPNEALVSFNQALGLSSAVEENPQFRCTLHTIVGQLLQSQNKHSEGLNHFNMALKIAPLSPTAYRGKASSLASLMRPEEALGTLQEGLKAMPHDVELHLGLADLLLEQGKIEQALVGLERAEELQKASPSAELLLKKARVQVVSRQFDAALATIEKGLKYHPASADSFNHSKAQVLSFMGKPDEALAVTEVLSLSPTLQGTPVLEEILELRARLLEDLGKRDEALAIHRQLNQLNPENVGGLLREAAQLLSLGKMKEALAVYRQALKVPGSQLTPDQSFHISSSMAEILEKLGQFEEALTHCTEALSLRPTARLHFLRGNIYRALGRLADAVAALESAAKLEPTNPWIFTAQGSCLAELGKTGDANKCYDKAIRLAPTSALAYRAKAQLALDSGNLAGALELFDQTLKLDPADYPSRTSRANVLLQIGRPEEALEACNQILASSPDHAGARRLKGVALIELGQVEDSLTIFDGLIAKEPGVAEHHVDKGRALVMTGAVDEALVSFDAALDLAPDHAEATEERANALLMLERFEEAVSGYDKAIARGLKSQPDGGVMMLVNKGVALFNLRREEEAMKVIDEALEIEPRNSKALNNKGVLLEARGHKTLAEEYYKLAQEAEGNEFLTFSAPTKK